MIEKTVTFENNAMPMVNIKIDFDIVGYDPADDKLCEGFSKLMQLRKSRKFLIMKDLKDCFNLKSVENPYIFYCGDKKIYRQWADNELQMLLVELRMNGVNHWNSCFKDYEMRKKLDLIRSAIIADELDKEN